MRSISSLAAAAAMAVLLTACGNQKEPAESAVAKVEASFTELKARRDNVQQQLMYAGEVRSRTFPSEDQTYRPKG